MLGFKVAFRKTKRGSVIKVRDYTLPEQKPPDAADANKPPAADLVSPDEHLGPTPIVEDARFQYPKHLTPDEVQLGLRAGHLLTGKFQASRENSLEGHASVTINGEDVHVLLQGRESLNRAIHDDDVVIELLPRGEWKTRSDLVLLPEDVDAREEEEEQAAADKLQSLSKSSQVKPTGKVVAITKRAWRQYTGVLRRQNAPLGRALTMNRCLFVPSDRRIPIIRIETRQYDRLKNHRLLVAIDSWPRASRYPQGHYVKSLGIVGDKDTENQVLLLEHDVPHLSFTDAVLDCLPPEGNNYTISDEELGKRADLRNINVCSVDPPGCTDIDDALHYREGSERDTAEVGVHIADVSHFVRPNTALDQEAANRGTTVYLSDRRIDMIPELLSSNLCSLIEHQDRLAFSVIWKIRKSDAAVLDVRFTKSVINSKASLTYEKAQSMIDDKNNKGVLHQSLRGLMALARKLKQSRMDRGALVLARTDEIRFVEVESETHERDESGPSLEIQHKQLVDTNSMVEEFMLLANISVANKLLEHYPQQALLRRHPRPSKANFDDLIESAKIKGFEIHPENGKSLSESLDQAKLPQNDFFNLMLRMIATRCMTPAAYFCSGYMDQQVMSFTHFGLAADLYTHFTSPIRRYADLLVHRLLASAIGRDTLDKNLTDSNGIQLYCDQINYRHRMAQLASRASARLHTVLYIKSKGELVEEAHVFFVKQNAIQVLIPRIAFEYTYFLKPSEDWDYDVATKSQTNKLLNVTIKQFDKLRVHVSMANEDDIRFSDKVRVSIVEPKIDEVEFVDKQMTTSAKGDENESPTVDDVAMDAGGEGQVSADKSSFTDSFPDIESYRAYRQRMRQTLSICEDFQQRKADTDASKASASPKKGGAAPVVAMAGDRLDRYISKESPTAAIMLGPGLIRLSANNRRNVTATKCGIIKVRNNNLFWIDCHQRRYVPVRGEYVIGVVRWKSSLHVRCDINSAESATLSLLAFEGATKRNKPNVQVGDLVYARILEVAKPECSGGNRRIDGQARTPTTNSSLPCNETELVCVNSAGKRDGLGVLGDKGGVGLLITLSLDTVRLLLMHQSGLLELLAKIHTRFEIALGINGFVWINSSEPSTTIRLANELRKYDTA